jgi:tRNA pseudouridine38-40 synthase
MSITSYLLTVSYVGTAYCGWQVQPGQSTVQGTIEDLLQKIFGKRMVLRYASRTDLVYMPWGKWLVFPVILIIVLNKYKECLIRNYPMT